MVHQLDDVFIDGLCFDRVRVEQFTFARFAGLLAVRGFDDGPATDDAVGIRRRPHELARHTDKTDRWLRLCLALLYVIRNVALSLALRCGWYQCGEVIVL
jgi:hypothetical protein